MSDTPSYTEQLAQLLAFPARLRQQVAGLSEASYRFRPAENEWSVIEVVGHLIDIDILMRARIGKMMATNHPALDPFDVNEMVRTRDYQHKNLIALVHSLSEHRAEFVEQIRYLRPEALSRTGIHPIRGVMSILDLVALTVRHDGIHTEQIANNLAAAPK